MNTAAEEKPLTAAIREWLAEHPLARDEEFDVYGVPADLFDLVTDDPVLKQLNRQIKSMPIHQQKLLLYLCRDFDPALIIESMEYTSPDRFWLDKAQLVKEVDPSDQKKDVLRLFEVNEWIHQEIIDISDRLERGAEELKNRKYRNYALVTLPVVLLLVILFVFPLILKPDPVSLYEEFRSAYRPDISSVDTVTFSGGSYFDALELLDAGNYTESARIFEELIPADSMYRVSSRWFLALINLRNGDKESCKELLRQIRIDNPDFFKQVAAELLKKL